MSLTEILLFPIAFGAGVGQFFSLLQESGDRLLQENGFWLGID